MSELQISLMLIGVAVIAAVYAYSAWQQRKYRHHFGDPTATPAQDDPLQQHSEPSYTMQPFVREEEDLCVTLDESTDYIATLSLASAQDASVLSKLWQVRFDLGMPVYICGKEAVSGRWERLVSEGLSVYSEFRLGMQLANRSGVANVAKLGGFRDLVRAIALEQQADAVLPDVAAAARQAQELDDFCATVDHMIGLNILPDGDRLLNGRDISRVAAQFGMELQSDGAFHLRDHQGRTLFSLITVDEEPFPLHGLEDVDVLGLHLRMDVPRVETPTHWFDEMVSLAQEIGQGLGSSVVDDYRAPLNEQGIAMIRSQVSALEQRMKAWPLPPGSALARRLFS